MQENKKYKLLFVQPQYSAKYIIDYLSQYFEITGLFIKDPRPYYPLNEKIFKECLLFFGMSDEATLKHFHLGQFDFVINGTDAAEELCCKLANLICPNYANSIDKLNKRWNKYYSIEALREAGVDSTWQRKVAVDELMQDKFKTEDFKFPCFMKPVNLVGGIGTGVCTSLDDAKAIIRSTPSEFCDLQFSEVLFQEIYTGEEYALDCFSFNGEHNIVLIAKYVKNKLENGRTYYRSIEILDPNSKLFKSTVTYISKVLDIVDFKFGLSHIEFFYDEDKDKFSLVEINPRASGWSGQFMLCSKMFRRFNVLDVLANKICGIPYESKTESINIDLVTLYANSIRKVSEVDAKLLDNLPSVVSYTKVKPAGYIATNDYTLADAVMFITLANVNKIQLEKDKHILFDLEKRQILF